MKRAILLVALLAAGCAARPGAPQEASQPAAPEPGLDALVPPTFSTLATLGTATNGAEPNLLVAPDGAVYVAMPLHLWRSDDGGRSFQALGADSCDRPQGVGLPACPPLYASKNPGLVGPNDGDLAATPGGTLLWTGLMGGGYAVPFQASTDRGASFSKPVEVGTNNSADRQWMDLRPDGSLLVVWRDAPGTAKEAFLGRLSPDAGASWGPAAPISGNSYPNGKPVHDLNGTWYLPRYEHGIAVSRSADGRNWSSSQVSQDPAQSVPIRNGPPLAGFPAAAVDQNGTIYVVWSEATLGQTTGLKFTDVPSVFLAVSHDHGASWGKARVVSAPGHASVLPALVAGAKGRIAVAWYEGQLGLPNEEGPDQWNVRVAESVDADADAPTFRSGLVSQAPIHVGGLCTDGAACLIGARDRFALDFFSIQLLPDGHPVLAFAGDAATGSRAQVAVLAAVAGGTRLA